MEVEQVGELVSVTFTWRIENFSKLKSRKHYSEAFAVGDFKWQIVAYPKGSSGNSGKHDLSIYLRVADASRLPSGWSRYAQFTLTVVNQLYSEKSITVETKHVFSERKSDWGFTSFMPLSELCDCTEGFLVNDICVLEAEVAVSQVDYKISERIEPSENEDQRKGPSNVDSAQVPESSILLRPPSFEEVLAFEDSPSSEQACTEPKGSPVDSSIVKEREETPSTPVGELMDFRGLGRIERAFVPLLEEVCMLHPSLIECQKKRSRMFTEWAFTALGGLLHFLKTTKGAGMTKDACEQLQLLWDEVGTFRFDLAWLEPHVQSALGMKKFVERALQVKKRRENVDALEIEIKRLKATLAVAEIDFEVSKRDMGEAKESCVGINMDSELGYARR